MAIRVFLFFLLSAAVSFAQTQPVFKGHQIGETAQQFFTVAKMAEKNGQLTTDYCYSYLADPKTIKAYEKAEKNKFDTNAVIASSAVKGCREVQAALNGDDVELGTRFAVEFAPGSVVFHKGKLVSIIMTISGARYEDVLTDMTTKLALEPTQREEKLQNAFGATLIQRKATWKTDLLLAHVSEMRSFRSRDINIFVFVGDRVFLEKKAEQRESSRPNTLD